MIVIKALDCDGKWFPVVEKDGTALYIGRSRWDTKEEAMKEGIIYFKALPIPEKVKKARAIRRENYKRKKTV